MSLDLIRKRLEALKPQLAEQFGVTGLSVFGSWARGEEREDSDLDLLVDFAAPLSLFQLARMDDLLERSLGLRVDAVPRDSLNPRFAPYIVPDLRPI